MGAFLRASEPGLDHLWAVSAESELMIYHGVSVYLIAEEEVDAQRPLSKRRAQASVRSRRSFTERQSGMRLVRRRWNCGAWLGCRRWRIAKSQHRTITRVLFDQPIAEAEA